MSEETIQPKQYLMVVDEITMAIMGRIMPGIRYLQVEGAPTQGDANYQVLVTPVASKEEAIPDETTQP